jgi:hypothetical protein
MVFFLHTIFQFNKKYMGFVNPISASAFQVSRFAIVINLFLLNIYKFSLAINFVVAFCVMYIANLLLSKWYKNTQILIKRLRPIDIVMVIISEIIFIVLFILFVKLAV